MEAKHEEVNVDVAQVDETVELGRIGAVRAAVAKVDTHEANTLLAKFTSLVVAWQLAQAQYAKAKDARESKRRAALVVRMMLQFIDGIRSALGFLEPGFSAQLPLRSKLETADPVGYAKQFIEVLHLGSERAKAYAKDLQAILTITVTEQAKIVDGDEQLGQLEKSATLARLKMREAEKTCEHFAHEHLPKKDPALKALHPKRKKPTTPPSTSVHKPSDAPAPAASETTSTQTTTA